MQQPVKNIWLSPQLQRHPAPGAASGAVRDWGAPPYFAGRERVRALEDLIARHESDSGDHGPRRRLPQRSSLRQMLTLTAAAFLLLGSAAFSYVAWSAVIDDGAAADRPAHAQQQPSRGVQAVGGHVDAVVERDAMRSSVRYLREENGELRQRLEALRGALALPP